MRQMPDYFDVLREENSMLRAKIWTVQVLLGKATRNL
jgi:hypothetical protein